MSTIISFFTQIYEWVVSLFSAVWEYLLELLSDAYSSVLQNVLDLIPDLSPMWSFLSPVQPYTAFINQWIALDTAATLLTAYFAFITTMIGVKLFIKLFIPTVG